MLSITLTALLAGVFVDANYYQRAQASSIVPVGSGSYTTAPPSNLTLPPNTIYRTANVTGPMPTNDWCPSCSPRCWAV
ncbi:MAG: hypothetical protein H0V70_25550 [Ktedonobacteraceae bacterium]|nr:hypothetical protein [Ktedonobacteraceae bacterium]